MKYTFEQNLKSLIDNIEQLRVMINTHDSCTATDYPRLKHVLQDACKYLDMQHTALFANQHDDIDPKLIAEHIQNVVGELNKPIFILYKPNIKYICDHIMSAVQPVAETLSKQYNVHMLDVISTAQQRNLRTLYSSA